jgi:hypothetical protein
LIFAEDRFSADDEEVGAVWEIAYDVESVRDSENDRRCWLLDSAAWQSRNRSFRFKEELTAARHVRALEAAIADIVTITLHCDPA